ncbi:MAG: histidinol-phosphate transaminase [Ruminococcaceae bacterium]|nr:histidinol-phosphate transaminase [Oscillospiraceae bacterium]
MSRFLAEKYQSLVAYTPGEQPTDMKYIKLNTNESPFPPSEGVIRAISKERVEELRLYSDPTCGVLREKIAKQFGVEKANVFVSNGSDDILNFSFMAFCDGSHTGVAFPEISYGFYSVYADLHRVDAKKIPLTKDFRVDYTDYLNVGRTVVIANPNAPTGIALSVREIEEIVKSNPDHVVLIDEAYVDFGAESALRLTEKYENLLVVRTFSKSYSLAGARLGFAIGHTSLIADLEKIKYSTNPYNINRLSLLAGAAAMDESDYYMENCKKIQENRAYTTDALRKLGFSVLPSSANFIFAKSDAIGGEELYLELKKRGILVRHFSTELIRDYNRITVGTIKEMQTLVETVRTILAEKTSD